MSALGWVWFGVGVLVCVLVLVLCVVLWNMFRVISSTRDMIDGVTRETVPLLAETGTTVTIVNTELTRVDGILVGVQGIVETTGEITRALEWLVGNPLVKLTSFAFGVREAVRTLSGSSQPARRGRRR